MNELRILNGTVLSDGQLLARDIAVDDGRIVEVAYQGALAPARDEIDARGLYVMPGVVDVHFHCRAPSHPERGDFDSETRAAAAGGVTTVFEMPISDPPASTPSVIRVRRELGERQAWVNFALLAGGAVRTEADAWALLEAGAIGFKLFTTTPPAGREEEFAGLSAPTEELIHRAFRAIAGTGATCTVHAEHQRLIDGLAGADGSRPVRSLPVVEAAAVAMAWIIGQEAGARLHIAHVSSRAAADVLRGARQVYPYISAETSPHYLVFNDAVVKQWRGYAKVAPPIRTEDDRTALWDAVRNGVITVIASDHAPFRPAEKELSDWDAIQPGIAGVELMLPLMLDAASRGELQIEDVALILSANPARLFGLYPAKGTVSVGSDADVVLFDPAGETVISRAALQTRARGCAVMYEGMHLRGRVVATFVGGRPVYQNGHLVSRAGSFVGWPSRVASAGVAGS